jgi:acetyl esterase/lipase
MAWIAQPLGQNSAWLEYTGDFAETAGVVIICPGGGYGWHSPRESYPIARVFGEAGYRPYILYYSVGEYLGTAPLEEAAEALRYVRQRQAGGPVFINGFSAGAHVAASLAVHWNNPRVFPDAKLRPLQRPDGCILCYPVISAGEFAHKESINRLVGDAAGKTVPAAAPSRDFFSLERHVSPDTPPCFLWHTAADESVPVKNSLLFAEALVQQGVEAELHIYPRGVHGLSLATEEVTEWEKGRLPDEHVAGWVRECIQWLRLYGGGSLSFC